MRVDYDRYSLRIAGERRLIRSGSLHYFRLPSPDLWWDRLEKMRTAGLNAVDVYYPWNYHSEAPGDYDWSGTRDVDRLHDMIEEAGLYLIARPGPYICAEIDMGGLPAWLFDDPQVFARCRVQGEYSYSRAFVDATREWFGQIVPRFASRPNLCLVQIENEYTVPAPLSALQSDIVDLAIRWLGTRRLARLAGGRWLRRLLTSRGESAGRGDRARGQTNAYMHDLYAMVRTLGVSVPIFHNDLAATGGRQMDVDILALDRYPIVRFDRDWRADPHTFDVFRGDAEALDAHGAQCPVFYPELQSGWYDGWGGVGYERVRERLGPAAIDNATKAALAERATLWNYYMFCGGVTWGYLASPDVYSSYDYAAPIAESGACGPHYQAVRELNEFLERYEAELSQTERDTEPPWCREHLVTRQGPGRRFVFLRNPHRAARKLPTPEGERATLEPWETQIRVYAGNTLEAVSPPPVSRTAAPPPAPTVPLPELERFSFSGVSPQLDPSYDDGAWSELSPRALEQRRISIDALGLHYGFVWYRGTFHGPLDRLELDARHCYAVWINRRCIAAGDQLQNTLGVGPDGARRRRIRVRDLPYNEGARNAIVILVESLGHNKGFADDLGNPRGLVHLDTGSTPVAWRYRGGLVRGERGITPVVAFSGVERGLQPREVSLPHSWEGDPGIGLYETRFRLEGADPKACSVGLHFDPGRGKANLYLNGHLLGRYWPERGPQQKFLLPWGVLHPDRENELVVAVWKRTEQATLGRLRLELM